MGARTCLSLLSRKVLPHIGVKCLHDAARTRPGSSLVAEGGWVAYWWLCLG
jgi:hypothetical protein